MVRFGLPLCDELFCVIKNSSMFLFMFYVNFFRSFIVLVLNVPETVVVSNGLFPIGVAGVTVPSITFSGPGGRFRLLTLTFHRRLRGLTSKFTATRLVIRSRGLDRSPAYE